MTEGQDKNSGQRHLQPISPSNQQLAQYDPLLHSSQHSEEVISLHELWLVFLKRKWTVISIALIFVVGAFLSTTLTVPEYRSTAQVQISPQQTRVLGFGEFDYSQRAGRVFDEYRATQLQLLRSTELNQRVVRNASLYEYPELRGEIRQRSVTGELRGLTRTVRNSVRDMLNGSATDAAAAEGNTARDPVPMAAAILRSRIEVQPIRDTHLVNISVIGFEPRFTAHAANALVAEYIQDSMRRRLDAGGEAREFLSDQLSEMRITLERSDQALMDFARNNQIADLSERLNTQQRALSQLSGRLSEVQRELVRLDAWQNLIDQGRINSLEPVANSNAIRDLDSRLLEARTRLRQLRNQFSDAAPEVREAQSLIAGLEEERQDRIQRIVEETEGRRDSLLAEQASLNNAVREQENAILSLNERSVQYNILRREFETSRELYDGLLQRMKEIGVASGSQENNIAVIETARMPGAPFRPNLQRSVLMGLALGLAAGLGLALMLEFLDRTIRSIEDIERLVDRPVLGMIPLVKLRGRDGIRRRKRPKVVENPEHSISHYSAIHSSSAVSEAFRSLRTSLSFSTAEGMPRVLMVTSSMVGEGKTTNAINLATVLAQNGSRVLLIDADLRKPRVHREFNRPRSPGLTNRIANVDAGGEENGAICPTHATGLFIMPAGHTTPNPAEMLNSPRLNKVIESCRRVFDHIIIDAPPILGLADSLILSRQVDGVMLVVKAGETTRENFKISMKRLGQVQAPVLGVVLNAVDLENPQYAYYASYYYNYQENAESDNEAEPAPPRAHAAT
ncbi:MAG: polysaccharide biosynthesis tyrosine autokinase [Wenzhouxiangella sp.]|nr:MAG: polysaccharide biosynthesis tyrosine autokinase [Wenzhouxiangella sp.]